MSKNDSLWSKIIKWLLPNKVATTHKASDIPEYLGYHTKKPPISYKQIKVLKTTPATGTISNSDFITVIHNQKPYWSIFKCPCKCGEVISLSLNPVTEPHWSVKQSKNSRPTLYPSVWQSQGCCSHFWIDDGRVYWCDNTGILPWVAKPDIYSKPKRRD